MTVYPIQVSGHASPDYGNRFKIFGKGFTVRYFVKEGEVLDYQTSEDIYRLLYINTNQSLIQVNTLVKEMIIITDDPNHPDALKSILNYNIWDLNDSRYVSGTLLAGQNTAIVNIAGRTNQDNPIRFKDLLNETFDELNVISGDSVTVYFNCCR
ncbi:hypothetical protein [Nostoc sp.]|uniref:hypothetical protein n=1 Tax=Nostoc sp. TaxID=1180 RepID=UPI002FFAA55D